MKKQNTELAFVDFDMDTMPKRDTDYMLAQKERILRATILCIARKGPERTSIPDICREAGLSTGALYVHFPNKSAIITEAMRYGSALERALPDNWEELCNFLSSTDGQLGFDLTTIVRFRLHMHAEGAIPGDLHEAMTPLLRESLHIFTKKLQELTERDEIHLRISPDEVAKNITALVEGRLWLAITTEENLDELSQGIRAAIALFIDSAGATVGDMQA